MCYEPLPFLSSILCHRKSEAVGGKYILNIACSTLTTVFIRRVVVWCGVVACLPTSHSASVPGFFVSVSFSRETVD